ncbi:TPA: 16S rRNA (adenine(1518)-N(6)/adenine(1519)-N(6))-dimethyltransferase [Candidatus Nomurabacteria bacterium]|nr:MAG: hypothetical protein O210_OD1C00001G0558 [Parcubacteria bacterium RAAC4_OD1_1]HCY26220.1 16S rRNA (adenine(1518)-N(6)/adenine(1519)-N(6))-dimethyltransferase [Candidatus Nomurabacteria bacterium]
MNINKNKFNSVRNTVQARPGQWKYKAKKHLGQNFLKSKEAIKTICDAGKVEKEDIILEIGPGKGVLTEELLKRGAKILAIEKDNDLINFLIEKFESFLPSTPGMDIDTKRLNIINEDILDFDISKYGLLDKKYKIIANIPYNITGAIIKKFLSEIKNKPILMAILVQKEVAERIVAKNRKINKQKTEAVQALPGQSRPCLDSGGKESILSLSVKAYGDPKYIMKVSKKYFSPAPKVDSAIILIDNISDKNFKNNDEEKTFFDLVHAGFSHKRKLFIKNIENLDYQKEKIKKMFEILEIDKKIRAEDIPFYKWIEMKDFLTTKN